MNNAWSHCANCFDYVVERGKGVAIVTFAIIWKPSISKNRDYILCKFLSKFQEIKIFYLICHHFNWKTRDRADKRTAHAQTKWRRRAGEKYLFKIGPKNWTKNSNNILHSSEYLMRSWKIYCGNYFQINFECHDKYCIPKHVTNFIRQCQPSRNLSSWQPGLRTSKCVDIIMSFCIVKFTIN